MWTLSFRAAAAAAALSLKQDLVVNYVGSTLKSTFVVFKMQRMGTVYMGLNFGQGNVTKIKVGYFRVLAQCTPSMENWFFPSSEVTRVLKMKLFHLEVFLFQLKKFERARVHDVTWWEDFEHAHWAKTRE